MKNEPLHALIHSLSRAECRYFRKVANQFHKGKQNKYLLLFDLLLQQPTYSESQLRVQLGDEKMSRQLNVAKHYLNGMILQNLRNFHLQKSKSQQLRVMLVDLELLYPRKLYKNCRRLIKKGRAGARALGDTELELGFLRWQRRLDRQSQSLEPEQNRDELEMHETLRQETCLIQLYDELFAISRISEQQKEGEIDFIQFELRLEEFGSRVNSFEGNLALQSAWAILRRLQEELQLSFEHLTKVLETWHRFPLRIQAHPNRYLNALSNAFQLSYKVGNENSFRKMVSNILSVENQAFPDNLQEWLTIRLLHMEMLYDSQQFFLSKGESSYW